jgi:hypothetical protein
MIVTINRVDKNCLPPSDIAVRKHLAPPVAFDEAQADPSRESVWGDR